ncbi:MAG: CcoQ/FixQ family Cbb3-type cytochrome c oxidase assembly chaperone [Lutibacter sp.]|nr:MAG: CcoQ/FixQ family Cbb3-type cytochrome c oxidase assembly chaperone [Lutibacter sp.]
MLRFIKHNLAGIDGVEIFPIISLLIFFAVFVAMLVLVFKLPKEKIDEVSQLPLDNNNNKEITYE